MNDNNFNEINDLPNDHLIEVKQWYFTHGTQTINPKLIYIFSKCWKTDEITEYILKKTKHLSIKYLT